MSSQTKAETRQNKEDAAPYYTTQERNIQQAWAVIMFDVQHPGVFSLAFVDKARQIIEDGYFV